MITLEGKRVRYEARSLDVAAVPDFANNAHEFLWDNAFRQGKENIEGEDADEMAGFFADFNVAYIAGRSDMIPWDDEVMKKWKKTDSFVPYYFELVQKEGAHDYTHFEMELE